MNHQAIISGVAVSLAVLSPISSGLQNTDRKAHSVHVSIVDCAQDSLARPTLTIRPVGLGDQQTPVVMSPEVNGVSSARISLRTGYYWFEPRAGTCGFAQAVAVLGDSDRWVTLVLEARTSGDVTVRDDHLDRPLPGALAGTLPLPGLTVICERSEQPNRFADQIGLVFGRSFYVDSLAPGKWNIKIEGTGWQARPILVTVQSGSLLLRNVTTADLSDPYYFHHLY